MVRDIQKFQDSLKTHETHQYNEFTREKERTLKQAYDYVIIYEYDKAENLFKVVDKMKFQIDKSAACLNFGHCSKLDKPVNFIPNVCQIETQHCFEHRK